MEQWVIYKSPSDFPGLYVARLWTIDGGGVRMTQTIKTSGTLTGIRAMLPPGLYRLERFEDDDPCIVEVWL